MINAKEARKIAEDLKNQVGEVAQLTNHFAQAIKIASNKGLFQIDKQTFAADRFANSVIDEVSNNLKIDGYKVNTTKNTALNQIVFHISW